MCVCVEGGIGMEAGEEGSMDRISYHVCMQGSMDRGGIARAGDWGGRDEGGMGGGNPPVDASGEAAVGHVTLGGVRVTCLHPLYPYPPSPEAAAVVAQDDPLGIDHGHHLGGGGDVTWRVKDACAEGRESGGAMTDAMPCR